MSISGCFIIFLRTMNYLFFFVIKNSCEISCILRMSVVVDNKWIDYCQFYKDFPGIYINSNITQPLKFRQKLHCFLSFNFYFYLNLKSHSLTHFKSLELECFMWIDFWLIMNKNKLQISHWQCLCFINWNRKGI